MRWFGGIGRAWRRRGGAGAVEYGLLVGLIAVAILGAIGLAGGAVSRLFTDTANCLSGGGAIGCVGSGDNAALDPDEGEGEEETPPGAPLLVLSVPSQVLDIQAPATTSDPVDVTVINDGTASAPVPAVSLTGPFTMTNGCTAPLAPDAECVIAVRASGGSGSYSGTLTVGDLAPVALTGSVLPAPVPASCLQVLENGTGATSGVYTIQPGSSLIEAYCDMDFAGGGWTMVVAQFESNPVAWGEGLQGDYAADLSGGASFAMADGDIPAHSQTAFGRMSAGGSPEILEGVTASYTTGNLNTAPVAGLAMPGRSYRIHRDTGVYFDCHELDGGCSIWRSGNPEWSNTLVLDPQTGSGVYADYFWAFSPGSSTANPRGYAYNGPRSGQADSFAWTVWVR